jgi:membrane-associated phospholipid phosphatase
MTDQQGLLTPPNDEPPRLPPWQGILRRIPWLVSQYLLFLVMFQAYKMVRKQFILEDNTGAFNHAKDIIHIEDSFKLFFELDLQRWVLDRGDWLILFFNNVYAYYTQAFLVSMTFFALMAPVRYRYMRRAFFISMAIATPMYLIYPLAPPRFMETYGWPFIDTMAVYGPNYFSDTGLVTANRFAAMPSMHVGWTTFFALCLMLAIPNRKIGVSVAVFFPALMTLTVMVTGNHYWLDAVGGWLVIGTALLINRLVPYPLLARLRGEKKASNASSRALA